MPKLTIDGQEIEVPAGMTVIQACEQLGIEIPRFCYHERLAIAGNCRMCLVEVSPGPPKPQASCAMPVADNMVVKTNTPLVKKAREGVMEFLLINHPLDCPICDQGGECDLQDQAMAYGTGVSRYHEHKRSVEDKYMGPLIKTQMTRCIHCTRCIRFITDVAGVPELGAMGRGEHMEVGTYVEKALTSELSANIIDLCPVGALTSRPYAFNARPWELKKVESIDVMDAMGSNIRVDIRGDAVMRVLPRVNEDINEEWISDKSRYACDGLRTQRLDRPYVRENGKLVEASWEKAFSVIAERVRASKGTAIGAIAGNQACTESMFALKSLMTALGSANIDCRQDGAQLDASDRASYLFNSTIAGIEQADVILLVGTNPRAEAAVLNARIRKTYLRGGLKVYNIGNPHDLTYPVEELGNDPKLLSQLLAGEHPLADVLKNARNPMMVLGMGAVAREDGAEILATAKAIADRCNLIRDGWNGFNMLHNAAARVGGLEIGFVPGKGGYDIAGMIGAIAQNKLDILYLLEVDEIDMTLFGNAFVIYQGHHGDDGAHRADVILPGAAYTEKEATYVNMEGRPQRTALAAFPPGEAKEDWKIIRALSDVLGVTLPFNTVEQLRSKMEEVSPSLAALDEITPPHWLPRASTNVRIQPAPFEDAITNFYMTDPISRASKTMAECRALALGKQQKAA